MGVCRLEGGSKGSGEVTPGEPGEVSFSGSGAQEEPWVGEGIASPETVVGWLEGEEGGEPGLGAEGAWPWSMEGGGLRFRLQGHKKNWEWERAS